MGPATMGNEVLDERERDVEDADADADGECEVLEERENRRESVDPAPESFSFSFTSFSLLDPSWVVDAERECERVAANTDEGSDTEAEARTASRKEVQSDSRTSWETNGWGWTSEGGGMAWKPSARRGDRECSTRGGKRARPSPLLGAGHDDSDAPGTEFVFVFGEGWAL